MNRNTFRLASLLSMALGLMGAGPGSCGFSDPELCVGLDEQACLQTDGCEPVYYQPQCACAPCREGFECPPCECGAPEFASCSAERPEPPPADRCAGLEEWACTAEPGCAPTYFASEPGLRCTSDRCLSGYAGCVEVGNPVCPAVACMMYCEAGMARDANGCEICACNTGCSSDAECGPGERCDAPVIDCLPGEPCPMVVGICVPDQRACGTDADCATGERCDLPEIICQPDGPCPMVVGICVPDQVCPPVLCDLWCENGFARDANGCETCRCAPAGCSSDADCAAGERCDVPEIICLPDGPCPMVYGSCVRDQQQCTSDSDCAWGESCDPTTGLCVPARRECRSDADCASGEQCVLMNAGCSADGVCPEPTGTCMATGCEPVACDLWCEGGFARDERGCEICACQPAGCSSDSDCAPGQVCESFATCTALGCPPPPPSVCVDRSCQADSDCAAGTVCRPDPKDPCSGIDLHYCLVPAHICQAPCAGLDEAGCVARSDCAATYVHGGGWCGNEMVFSSCSDR